jgi:hypothetical protein
MLPHLWIAGAGGITNIKYLLILRFKIEGY